jgi:hypothetical protein
VLLTHHPAVGLPPEPQDPHKSVLPLQLLPLLPAAAASCAAPPTVLQLLRSGQGKRLKRRPACRTRRPYWNQREEARGVLKKNKKAEKCQFVEQCSGHDRPKKTRVSRCRSLQKLRHYARNGRQLDETPFQDLARNRSQIWDRKGPKTAEKQNIIHSRMLYVSPSRFGPISGTDFGPKMVQNQNFQEEKCKAQRLSRQERKHYGQDEHRTLTRTLAGRHTCPKRSQCRGNGITKTIPSA